MAATFYLSNTNSDLSGGADFNKKLVTSPESANTISVSIASNATETSYAFTEPGVPGTGGATGDYSVEINITTANADAKCTVSVARVNSSGTVQTGPTTLQVVGPFSSTGVYTASKSGVNLGTWAAGDRLRVDFAFQDNNSMDGAGETFVIGTGTTSEETVTPFTVLNAYTMAADAGTFTLTGASANLLFGHVLAAASGSFALTGATTGLLFKRLFSTATGSFVLTGATAGLFKGFTTVGGSGSFVLTGSDVSLLYKRLFATDAGAFTLTGANAGLYWGRFIVPESGAFALNGAAASFSLTRVLTPDAGSFVLTGANATLFKALILQAEAAQYALLGAGIDFRYYKLSADSGVFVFEGADAELSAAFKTYLFKGARRPRMSGAHRASFRSHR